MAVLPTFTTLGTGPTVLMLHDADGGHLTFAPQVETLASAGYRAVAWDMPGYGHSAPIEPYTFKGLAQSCLALMDALQCGPVALVGHGMGAMVALEAAVRRPAAVRRMVLCAGGPALDSQALDDWVAPRLRALKAADAEGDELFEEDGGDGGADAEVAADADAAAGVGEEGELAGEAAGRCDVVGGEDVLVEGALIAKDDAFRRGEGRQATETAAVPTFCRFPM